MNRRGATPEVPQPMRASSRIIQRCRNEVDNRPKRFVRHALNAITKLYRGLSEIGEGFQIGLSTKVPKYSRLGRYGYIGHGFSAPSPVCVGDLCMISTNVVLVSNDHGIDSDVSPIRLEFRWEHLVTVFEADVWVGHGAIIRSGIKLGRGSVVAAGSVVIKDVLPYSVVGGNPAREIRKRFPSAQMANADYTLYGV